MWCHGFAIVGWRPNAGDVVTCAQNIAHGDISSKECDVTYLDLYTRTTIWMEVRSQEAYDVVAEILAKK